MHTLKRSHTHIQHLLPRMERWENAREGDDYQDEDFTAQVFSNATLADENENQIWEVTLLPLGVMDRVNTAATVLNE